MLEAGEGGTHGAAGDILQWPCLQTPIHCSISAGCPRSYCWCWPVLGLWVRHWPAQSSTLLITFLQGICISTGKHVGAAGQESLKTWALDYWSRNSYFLPCNYICFATGLHNSRFKSFGTRQVFFFFKFSNHCSFYPFSLTFLGLRPLWPAPDRTAAAPSLRLVRVLGKTPGPGCSLLQTALQLLGSRDQQSTLCATPAIFWSYWD